MDDFYGWSSKDNAWETTRMRSQAILFQINLFEKVAKFGFVIADKFRKVYEQILTQATSSYFTQTAK